MIFRARPYYVGDCGMTILDRRIGNSIEMRLVGHETDHELQTMNSNSPGGGHDETHPDREEDFVFSRGPSLRNNKTCSATDSRGLPVGNVYKFLAHGVIGGLPIKYL